MHKKKSLWKTKLNAKNTKIICHKNIFKQINSILFFVLNSHVENNKR